VHILEDMEERSKVNPDAELNDLGTIVIQTAISVHRSVGPGLLESVYEAILTHELRRRGLAAERQVAVSFEHDGIRFDEGFRADIVVSGRIIL
jgi:GxxExxY protein